MCMWSKLMPAIFQVFTESPPGRIGPSMAHLGTLCKGLNGSGRTHPSPHPFSQGEGKESISPVGSRLSKRNGTAHRLENRRKNRARHARLNPAPSLEAGEGGRVG